MPRDESTAPDAPSPIFSDTWLYEENAGDDAEVLGCPGSSGCYPPHPALKVARSLAAFPLMPCDWDMVEARWELMAAFPPDVTAVSHTSADLMRGALHELDVVWSLGESKSNPFFALFFPIFFPKFFSSFRSLESGSGTLDSLHNASFNPLCPNQPPESVNCALAPWLSMQKPTQHRPLHSSGWKSGLFVKDSCLFSILKFGFFVKTGRRGGWIPANVSTRAAGSCGVLGGQPEGELPGGVGDRSASCRLVSATMGCCNGLANTLPPHGCHFHHRGARVEVPARQS